MILFCLFFFQLWEFIMKLHLPLRTLTLLLIMLGLVHGCGTNEIKENQVRTKSGRILDSKKTMALAKQGDKAQQLNLGIMYLRGQAGLAKNPKLAASWLEKSAKSGVANAQFLLGDLYVDGVGVKKDHKKALFWYKKSAAQAHPMAMYSVGAMYANGFGVKKDTKQARHWFQQATWKGNGRAKKALIKLDKLEAKNLKM